MTVILSSGHPVSFFMRFFLLLALAFALAACVPATLAPTSTPEPTTPPTPLLTMVVTGGLCEYGLCYQEMQVDTAGAFTLRRGDEVVRQGYFDAGQLAALKAALPKADFVALRAIPFTEMCPTAYDGSQVIYTFHTAHGPEILDSCAVVLDPQHLLLEAADALFRAAWPVE